VVTIVERKRLGDTPARPTRPPKKKGKGGRPRTKFASANDSPERTAEINRRYELTPEEVNDAIIRCKGVLSEAATLLGVRRLWLRNFITDRKSCAAVYKEAREEMGDVAECRLYELIEAGHFPAIVFYLSTVHKNRGYGQGRNAQVPGITNAAITHIDTVNIVAIPSGTYLSADDIKQLAPTIEATPIKTDAA
jgi:hypothetical protein